MLPHFLCYDYSVILICSISLVLDLASHTRLLLFDRPKHTRLYRWLALYPLYVLSEIAIIATDLAELLGSAIALCLLFPKLQLWHGVLLTAVDVILILAMSDPLRGKPARMFELLIAVMVCRSAVCQCLLY
jgi:metal iron transporter